MNCLLVSLTVFTLITNPIDAKGKCNDDCLTKTYCLSPSGSTECSKNNLVSATWSVIESSKYYDTVGLKLVAENVEPSEGRSVSLVFKSPVNSTSLTVYNCLNTPAGGSAMVTQRSSTGIQVIEEGDASYSSGVLTCTWSFHINSYIWPLFLENPASLVRDDQGIIELHSGSQSAIVATNVRDLPIYRFQYLKCCNNVHGNGDYLVAFNQKNDVRYLMRPINLRPQVLSLSMKMSTGIQLLFTCDFGVQMMDSYLYNGTSKISIDNIIYDQYISAEFYPQCYWSHPLTLNSTLGDVSMIGSVFDMQIMSGSQVVYTEKDVTLIDDDN